MPKMYLYSIPLTVLTFLHLQLATILKLDICRFSVKPQSYKSFKLFGLFAVCAINAWMRQTNRELLIWLWFHSKPEPSCLYLNWPQDVSYFVAKKILLTPWDRNKVWWNWLPTRTLTYKLYVLFRWDIFVFLPTRIGNRLNAPLKLVRRSRRAQLKRNFRYHEWYKSFIVRAFIRFTHH